MRKPHIVCCSVLTARELIAEQDGLREEFDEQLFKMTAEKIVVSKEHDITFCLYNGLKLTERGGGQDAVAHANRL